MNFNARLYNPALGVFLAIDPMATSFAGLTPYNFGFDNPTTLNDPGGECPVCIIAIVAAVFGTTNLAIQASNGEINNFGDGAKAFFSGAIAGAALATGVITGLGVPVLGTIIKGAGIVYGGTLALGTVSGLGDGVFNGDWSRLGNTWKTFAGNFYLDGNRNIFGQTWQGISRFSWELPQSTIGHGYSQLRNTFGGVDRVDYFGGATFSIQEFGNGSGISMGNHINANVPGNYNGVPDDPLLMHEYGHTFDSQLFGFMYLPIVGVSSIRSANRSVWNPNTGAGTHAEHWTERRANRHAARYFEKYHGVDWSIYETPFNLIAYLPR